MSYQYNNVITIYDRLCDIYDKLSIEEQKGYAKALYILSAALKRFEGINLHLENKTLRKALYKANLSLDDHAEDKHVIYRENKRLKGELLKSQSLVKTLQGVVHKKELIKASAGEDSLREVNIDYQDKILKFYISCSQEEFDKHFQAALQTVKDRKKTKHYHDQVVRDWFMLYYRELGFTCSPFK